MGMIKQRDMRKLVGKRVYAVKKDGSIVTGKLIRAHGSRLFVETSGAKGKRVKTKAILPLVLFDLLAVGGVPYGGVYAGYPYGGAGFGGYPIFY